MTPMVDLGMYYFKPIYLDAIKPEYYSKDAYIKEVFKFENFCTSNKQIRIIFYAKYENLYLTKFMKEQYQHLT